MRAKAGVELHAIAAVDVILELIVHPHNTESDHALGLDHALENASLLVLLLVGSDQGLNREENLFNSLQEQLLVRILGLGLGENSLNISVHWKQPPSNIPHKQGKMVRPSCC